MSKFKLVREYPGSPKKGTECSQLENDTITAYPEFWEKVEELDYEILILVGNRNGWDYKKGVSEFNIALSSFNSGGNFTIKSIKRLSDGVVFSIDDKLGGYDVSAGRNGNISKFYIEDGRVKVGVREVGLVSLNNCKHIKLPLFKTEDGVDIFKGDKYWYSTAHLKLYQFIGNSQSGKDLNYKYFSTKELAQSYIDENKPKYSENDLYNLLNGFKITREQDLHIKYRLKMTINPKDYIEYWKSEIKKVYE